MSDLTKPRTNEELILAAISGDYSGELPAPTTRVQQYLAKIYKNGMGGGGGSGADGFSPVANVTQTENGATIPLQIKPERQRLSFKMEKTEKMEMLEQMDSLRLSPWNRPKQEQGLQLPIKMEPLPQKSKMERTEPAADLQT